MNIINHIKQALRAVADRLRSWVVNQIDDELFDSAVLEKMIKDNTEEKLINFVKNSSKFNLAVENIISGYDFVDEEDLSEKCEEAIDDYDFSNTINEFLSEREYVDYDKALEMLDAHDFTTALQNSPGLSELIDQRMEERASELVIDSVCDHTQRLEERIEKLEATLKALGGVLNAS